MLHLSFNAILLFVIQIDAIGKLRCHRCAGVDLALVLHYDSRLVRHPDLQPVAFIRGQDLADTFQQLIADGGLAA